MKIVPNMNTFKIMSEDGYVDFNGVSRVKVTDADAVKITVNNTETYTFTVDHVLYTQTGKITAGSVVAGTLLDDNNVVTAVEAVKYTGYVYDIISVDNKRSNFIVGKQVKVNSSNCVVGSSKTKYRNKITGEIVELSMDELKELLKSQ